MQSFAVEAALARDRLHLSTNNTHAQSGRGIPGPETRHRRETRQSRASRHERLVVVVHEPNHFPGPWRASVATLVRLKVRLAVESRGAKTFARERSDVPHVGHSATVE